MRKFSSYLISIFLIALFSTPVFAKNEVCDALKADGVTKGLYGLCIAYHASGANNQAILDNYNRMKSPSDPVMPGTDDNPHTLSCACWSTLTAEEIGADPALEPGACFLSPDLDLISYDTFDSPEILLSEYLSVGTGYCVYTNALTDGSGDSFTYLDSDQEDVCRLEILELAYRDFQGFENCLSE